MVNQYLKWQLTTHDSHRYDSSGSGYKKRTVDISPFFCTQTISPLALLPLKGHFGTACRSQKRLFSRPRVLKCLIIVRLLSALGLHFYFPNLDTNIPYLLEELK